MVIPGQHSARMEYYAENTWHPLRIESITEQLRQICYTGSRTVLEVGVGSGFLRHCLEFFPEVELQTLDTAAELQPDRVGSVLAMPFDDGQFDLVVCCQVLEHLPFDDFLPALRELRRVARHRVLLSLPDTRRHLGLAFCLLRWGWRTWEFNPPRWKNARRFLPANLSGHHWEIGYGGTLGVHIKRKIRAAGFRIERQYRLHKHPWHEFYVSQ